MAEDSKLRERLGRRSLEIIEDWNLDLAARGLGDAVAATVGPARWARAQPPVSRA
jgi:hypothetical protein